MRRALCILLAAAAACTSASAEEFTVRDPGDLQSAIATTTTFELRVPSFYDRSINSLASPALRQCSNREILFAGVFVNDWGRYYGPADESDRMFRVLERAFNSRHQNWNLVARIVEGRNDCIAVRVIIE